MAGPQALCLQPRPLSAAKGLTTPYACFSLLPRLLGEMPPVTLLPEEETWEFLSALAT